MKRMKKKLVISNIFLFSPPPSPLGVIKNSACDCPSQLLYFVYFFSLSPSLGLWAFLFKSRSYQLFLQFFSASENMIMTLHCSLKSIKQSRFGWDQGSDTIRNHEIKTSFAFASSPSPTIYRETSKYFSMNAQDISENLLPHPAGIKWIATAETLEIDPGCNV